MFLRSAVRGPAQMAARLAIPLLAVGGSGPAQLMRRGITTKRAQANRQPKIDCWRFPSGEMVGFTPANTVRVLNRTRSMKSEIERAFSLLADDRSRELLTNIMEYRALGPSKVELPDTDRKLGFYDQARRLQVGDATEPYFYPFDMHLYEVDGIRIECWLGNVVASFLERQYFFERGDVRIRPETGDTIIDAGACFGDTALCFAQAVGERGKVHSFEPMPRQRQVLDRNLAHNAELARRIAVHSFAVLDESGKQLNFADGGVAARASASGGIPVQSIAIDDFVTDRGIRPDFIKMDIEGAEPAAIEGARSTLQSIRPKLGISIYHSFEDLFGIIGQIHDIQPAYEFYIDHHTVHVEETILYARPVS